MVDQVQYSNNSFYSNTPVFGNFLDVASFPTIPKMLDDVLFTVNATYRLRPDLLAFDLYGDSALWWVFALRNPNAIQDPVFDMVPGLQIYLPKKETILAVMR